MVAADRPGDRAHCSNPPRRGTCAIQLALPAYLVAAMLHGAGIELHAEDQLQSREARARARIFGRQTLPMAFSYLELELLSRSPEDPSEGSDCIVTDVHLQRDSDDAVLGGQTLLQNVLRH